MNKPAIASQPLAGRRVLVTRAKHQSPALSALLRQFGAEPVELPVLEIVPLPLEPLEQALDQPWDWILFTSANTVRLTGHLVRQLQPLPQIAAIGTATAGALKTFGIAVDLMPESFIAEAVLEVLVADGVDGKRILLPVAETARQVLPDGLRAAGATVEAIPVYRTVRPEDADPQLIDAIRSGNVDTLTFTSPSSVRNTMHLLGGALPADTTIACIGPITARELAAAGYTVDIVATDSTAAGLVQALVSFEEGQP